MSGGGSPSAPLDDPDAPAAIQSFLAWCKTNDEAARVVTAEWSDTKANWRRAPEKSTTELLKHYASVETDSARALRLELAMGNEGAFVLAGAIRIAPSNTKGALWAYVSDEYGLDRTKRRAAEMHTKLRMAMGKWAIQSKDPRPWPAEQETRRAYAAVNYYRGTSEIAKTKIDNARADYLNRLRVLVGAFSAPDGTVLGRAKTATTTLVNELVADALPRSDGNIGAAGVWITDAEASQLRSEIDAERPAAGSDASSSSAGGDAADPRDVEAIRLLGAEHARAEREHIAVIAAREDNKRRREAPAPPPPPPPADANARLAVLRAPDRAADAGDAAAAAAGAGDAPVAADAVDRKFVNWTKSQYDDLVKYHQQLATGDQDYPGPGDSTKKLRVKIIANFFPTVPAAIEKFVGVIKAVGPNLGGAARDISTAYSDAIAAERFITELDAAVRTHKADLGALSAMGCAIAALEPF